MQENEIKTLIKAQKEFFHTGKTLPAAYRIENLKRLRALILERSDEINEALLKDLGKSSFESYMCETGLALNELSYMIKHIKKFSRQKTVKTDLVQFAAHSFQIPSPYGTVLIMSPWNYPFLLTIDPLIDALAAGNTAIVKPSAYSPATSDVIQKLIKDCFPPEYVTVITGGREENQCLFRQKFDYLFFTGSQAVGKEVMRHASEHLTPVTLELGGKSPCIVDSSATLSLAAKRIVFGKYLNCGQTCVAPDYVLCPSSLKNDLISALKKEIRKQFGEFPLENSDYGKIINQKQFDRISRLIDTKKIVYGGTLRPETMQIEPAILDNVTWDDAIMQEEIFGPLLPILTYDSLDEVISLITAKPSPLALYFFSSNKKNIRKVLHFCSFGGGCVNDTIIHLATPHMGFGGIGASGMGAYHGKAGFTTFSHYKSIIDKKTWIDLPMRYQPYTNLYKKMLQMFLK